MNHPLPNRPSPSPATRCHLPSRWRRAGQSLAGHLGAVALAAGLLAGATGHAQPVNLLKFPLTNAPGTTVMPSDTSLGGVSVNLTMYNGAGTVTNFSGLAGSGVNGAVTGARALCLTNNETGTATASANNNGAANSAADLGDATLAFGTITNFAVTMWVKEPVVLSDSSGYTLPRLFVLGAGISPGGGEDVANSIGVKFQLGNQFELVINNATATTGNSFNAPANTATLGTTLASDLVANKWYFLAWVYDGTNIYQYTGSDSATATLQNQYAAAGLSVNLSNPTTLLLGNKTWKGTRGYFGSLEDFRFYHGVSTNNLTFVESIRKQLAPSIPAITGIYPDGTMLMQATNKLVFTAQSASGYNLTNIDLKLNSVDVSSGCTFVTNGTAGTSTNVTVTYVGLAQQAISTAVISATDGIGLAGSTTVKFDTFSPTNLVVKAEEFDHDSGQYIDNPDYTATNGDANSYYQLSSTELVDTHKGSSAGLGSSDYRYDNGVGTVTQTPLIVGELPWWRFPTGLVDGSGNPINSHMISDWSSGEWQNYTKTFPSGNYNVYARLATATASTVRFDQVTSGQGSSSQTTANLGSFTFSGSGGFQWVPLLKNGTLAVVNLAGVSTVRATTGGGAQADLYMLVPANPNLPTISNVYPDGQYLFEPTNKLVFTASSSAGINNSNITLTLNGTNASAGLAFSGGPKIWNVSYSGLLLDQAYAAVISVTDSNAANTTATLSIDTWNPVFQFEAEDFDFDPANSPVPGTGNRYIDNPVPTIPGVTASNSYEGQIGDKYIDESVGATTPPYAGASSSNYRPNDPTATTVVTDTARKQFATNNALDYNVGFLGAGYWQNYTRTWPAGTYNVYGRMASGAASSGLPTPPGIREDLDQVIAGWGTTNLITQHLGTFNIPTTNGYSSYLYVPLMDRFGNYAQVALGGTNTFRTTLDLTTTAGLVQFGLNVNFYMLTAPRTDLPRLDAVYPDGSVPMQATNTLSFVASSPTYGISTNNIGVTLNGVNVSSNLLFSGSSSSWNVSYAGLLPNMTYTAVISTTDNVSQIHSTTVTFDTFSQTNFTWEAEDFDFDTNESPVPNGTALWYIDSPAITSGPATNSYYGQVGDLGIDYSTLFNNIIGSYAYRPYDFVSTEVTSDPLRQKYQTARLLADNIAIEDYDVDYFTNWIDYTRTFPTGNYLVYARLSAGNGAFSMQCAQVTDGVGTSTQTTNVLGSFTGTGTSFNTWQYVPLTNAAAGSLAIVSLGGVATLQMTGDLKENANYFMLVPVVPTFTATLGTTNLLLSFPTVSGLNYTVLYKQNLTDPTWTPLGAALPGNGASQSVSDSLTQGSRFYRLEVQ